MRIRRPSPALAIAFTALVVATGGSAYAISKLPPGSVHTAQLKRNAVSSPKVKDGSLQLADLGPAAVTGLTGPRGGHGAGGQPGVRGQDGASGGPGPRGPTTAFVSSNTMPVTLGAAPAQVASISLPAGRYETFARVTVSWLPSAPSSTLVNDSIICSLASSAGGTGDSATQTLIANSSIDTKTTIPLVSWQDLSGPATVTISCSDVLSGGESVHAVATTRRIASLKTETLSDGTP